MEHTQFRFLFVIFQLFDCCVVLRFIFALVLLGLDWRAKEVSARLKFRTREKKLNEVEMERISTRAILWVRVKFSVVCWSVAPSSSHTQTLTIQNRFRCLALVVFWLRYDHVDMCYSNNNSNNSSGSSGSNGYGDDNGSSGNSDGSNDSKQVLRPQTHYLDWKIS